MADSLAPTTSTSPAPQQAKRVKIAKPKLGKPEGPGRCHYFVARKNKYCSLIPKTDQYYCGEHAVFVTFPATTAPGDNAAASNATPADRSSGQATAKEADTTTAGAPLTVLPQRVPCPLDPSHTVNLKGLERHMKFRCNARPPETTPAYFREDYNVAGVRHPEPTEGPVVDPRLMHELGDLSSVSFAYRKKSKLYHDLIQNQLGQRVTLPAKAAAEAEAVTAIETEVVAVAGALPATLDQVPPTPAANATGLPPFAKLDWSELSQLAQRASAIYTRQADQFRERHPLPSCPSGTSDSSSTPPLFPTEILDHPALNQRRQQKTAVKHVVQQASLLGQLEKLGLLRPTYQFVEFGAGKGELSTFVQTAFNLPTESASPVPEVAYTLVDRRNFRNKFDREVGHTVRRIQIDIKDLDLARVDGMLEKPVVAYSKHLCGAATDITLRCLDQFIADGGQVAGIAIALCCHHCCSYPLYMDQEYLASNGIDAEFFARITSMSSWATCATRTEDPGVVTPPSPNGPKNTPSDDVTPPETAGMRKGSDPDYIEPEKREVIGHQCKRIYDFGRVQYLERMGFDVRLVYYVEPSASLENLALVAVPRTRE